MISKMLQSRILRRKRVVFNDIVSLRLRTLASPGQTLCIPVERFVSQESPENFPKMTQKKPANLTSLFCVIHFQMPQPKFPENPVPAFHRPV